VLTAPADEVESKLALEFALAEGKPVCLRYPRDLVPSDQFDRTACAEPFELGKSVVVKESPDSTVAIVAYGSILTEALVAARLLEQDGIALDVINARFAAPVDEKIISLLEKGKSIITVEDHSISCGFGSAVLELAAAKMTDSGYDKRCTLNAIRVLGMPRRFIRHDSRKAQLIEAGVNADKIAQTAKEMSTAPKKRKRK